MKVKNVIIVVVVIGVLLGAKFLFFPAEDPAQQGKKMQGAPSNVTAYVLRSEKLNNDVYATGTVLANEEVILQPELSGKIIQLNFREGEAVKKGQLLVKINDADLQANYKKLDLQLSLAEEKLKRQKQLLSISGISQEEYDIAQNQFNVIKADLDYVAAQIAKTEVKAPFDGVIGLKNVSEGAYVSPATNIASIQQLDPVKIDFSVAERYSSAVKKGDKVLFSVEGVTEVEGLVYAVDPKIDIATRTIQVRAICKNSKNAIYPGAFARVKLLLNDIDSALMIPTEAVIPDLKGKKVYRIKNNTVEPAKVITGLRNDSRVQIIDGLENGDTIVVRGIMQLKPGAVVKITEIKK